MQFNWTWLDFISLCIYIYTFYGNNINNKNKNLKISYKQTPILLKSEKK